MDSKLVEVIGRNFLTAELLAAGLEVAAPIRDRGIDLLAYRDLDSESGFHARPIQLKAAWNQSFGIYRKYQPFPSLLLVYVWGLSDISSSRCYAMSHAESVGIGKELGWTETDSWRVKGTYITTKPSAKLCELLEPFRVARADWSRRVAA